MRRPLFALFVAVAVAVAALLPAFPAAAQRQAPELSDSERAVRAQWAAEVRDLRMREKADLGELHDRAVSAHGTASFAKAQRELEAAKQDWRLRVLDAQLRYARLSGKTESASRIEERMRELRELAAKRTAPAGQGGGR